MMKDILIFYDKIVFLLSNASIRYFETFFNADGDFEFIDAIILCIEGRVYSSIFFKYFWLRSRKRFNNYSETPLVRPHLLQQKSGLSRGVASRQG